MKQSKRVGKLYDTEFIALEGLPDKDKVYVTNGVQIVEKYNSEGEILDVQMMDRDNKPVVPTPNFISAYKERLKNFGKVFVILKEPFDDKY